MRFATGSLGVVMDERFNVLAEFGPRFVGVVYLLISLSEAAVGGEGGVTECEDDGGLMELSSVGRWFIGRLAGYWSSQAT